MRRSFVPLVSVGLLAACVACSAAIAPQTAQPTAASGIPGEALPLRLPRTFVPVAYEARLAVDPAQPTFSGSITIHADVPQPAAALWLHGRGLLIQRAELRREGDAASSWSVAVTPRGEELLLVTPSAELSPGRYELTLDYTGTLDLLNTTGAFKQTVGGAPYVFTQFEAVYARRVFPSLDEPDNKVPWQLTLDVPGQLRAVSNTPLTATTPLPNGWLRHSFERSPPLPSYLVAFGVGPFDIVDGPPTRSGVPVRMVTPAGRGRDATYALQTTARILDLLEEWFGTPYPYEKLDLLTIPLTVGFGAMENAGLVTFSENLSLFTQSPPSWHDRHLWVVVAAHELAHQWFGNYVTTAWWDDIWLNEGFASWMESKIASRFEPAWRDPLGELDRAHDALDADRVASARRIREPIASADDIFNVFDSITYDKGATLLNMFESYTGAEVFQRGVRDYLAARAWGNATSQDFIVAVSHAAGKDLGPAFATFLEQPGAPELAVRLRCEDSPPRVELSQARYVPPGSPPPPAGTPWHLPVCVAYERGGQRAEACGLLEATEGSIPLEGSGCPSWIMPNVDGRGYFRVRYSPEQAATMRERAWPALSWSERRAVFFDLEQAALWGRPGADPALPPVLALLSEMLAGGDRFTITDAVGFARALDRFMPDDLRERYEGWLRATFGARARALGLLPAPGDDLDAETSRQELVFAAAVLGRDPALMRAAAAHQKDWHDLPASMRRTILTLLVDSDPAFGSAVAGAVRTEPDQARRTDMLFALARASQPARLTEYLALLLDPGVDIRESMWMLAVPATARTRRAAADFFRGHEAQLMQRIPRDEVSSTLGVVSGIFTSDCDESRRDEVVRYVTERFASLPGGKHVVEQSLETLDQCIRARAALEPELRRWLTSPPAGGSAPPAAAR